jgi:hypothetical protein
LPLAVALRAASCCCFGNGAAGSLLAGAVGRGCACPESLPALPNLVPGSAVVGTCCCCCCCCCCCPGALLAAPGRFFTPPLGQVADALAAAAACSCMPLEG